MPAEDLPSIDHVRQCLRYEDGKLFWLVRPREHFKNEQAWKAWNTKYPGTEAGGFGYLAGREKPRWQILLKGRLQRRYKIVWLLHHGEWVNWLDHKDGDRLNDRVENLRISTPSQNLVNRGMRRNNTSGYRGVSWNASGCTWAARITVEGRHVHLGNYADPAEASVAYEEAAKKYHGEFYCPC